MPLNPKALTKALKPGLVDQLVDLLLLLVELPVLLSEPQRLALPQLLMREDEPWDFLKVRVPYLGVPFNKDPTILGVLYWGPLFFGNPHIGTS